MNNLKAKDQDECLKVHYVKIKDLVGQDINPRLWSPKVTQDLMESIKRFGLSEPIILNGHKSRFNRIIGGHFRVHCASKLGYEKIPAVYVSIDDTKRESEFALRLNRNQGIFDSDLLKEFDLELLVDVGFDDSDLSAIWDNAFEVEDDNFRTDKEIPKISEPTVKTGEIYSIGNQIIGCGNSTDQDFVKKVLNDNLVDLIYCDPIYDIGLDYSKGISTNGKYGGQERDRMSEMEYEQFIKKTIENALSVAKPDCHCFYWSDQNHIGLIQKIFRELGLENRRVCLWIKNNFNPTPKVAFNKAYEPCTYATRGTPFLAPINNLNEVLNKEIAVGNRTIDDIADIFDIWLVKRLPAQEYTHPTEKNPTLHEKPLRRCSKINDVVLDLFGGSFSTAVACHQLKRRSFSIDIDPLFCTLGINRLEKLSGEKAKLISEEKE